MDVRTFLLGRGEFKSSQEIIEIVARSDAFDPSVERVADAEALLMFQTSKQQTWLVATHARLYCVLDDLNKGSTRVQWSLPADKLVANSSVVAEVSVGSKTDKTGLLRIGERRNWLFTKRLFATKGIEAAVRDLIARHMLDERQAS
jgi:hypothetical protein